MIILASAVPIDANIDIDNSGELRLHDDAGSEYVSFKAPNSLAGTVNYTLPPTDGSSGQKLSTNGSGILSWASSPASDNLGNHETTQNLDLNGFKLVGNGGTAGLTIDSSGNVGIKTAAPTTTLHVTGTILATGDITTAGNYHDPGVVSSGTTFSLCFSGIGLFGSCTSLRKYKTAIKKLDLGLKFLSSLKPVRFHWKDSGEQGIGFIAEDIEHVEPALSIYFKDELRGIQYGNMTAILVNAIREVDSKSETLRMRLKLLEVENIKLKDLVKKTENAVRSLVNVKNL